MSGHYDEDHGYVPGTPRLRPLLAAKEAAIRADERAKCRAELREKLQGLTSTELFIDRWIAVWDWARTEAFGGVSDMHWLGYIEAKRVRADERRRVVDELWTFLDDLRLPGIKAAAVATKLNEMRGDDG